MSAIIDALGEKMQIFGFCFPDLFGYLDEI